MANLKEIRIRLNSVKSTRQITSAMKMVSAAKLRKAQDSILGLRPFYNKLYDIVSHVNAEMEQEFESVFSHSSESGKILIVMITSNRGLCGAFNSNIVKRTIQAIHGSYSEAYNNGKLDIIAIGKKGADQLKSKGYKVLSAHNELFDKLSFENTVHMAEWIMNNFTSGTYGVVKLIYNQFRNAAVQEVKEELFLPLMKSADGEAPFESHADYIYEPTRLDILQEIIPYTLKVQLFRSLLESSASEHGARMTAMHKATDNATELIRELELNYNKARQAAITGEILEIVGGAEALNK